jgi:hypothetical protein
MRTEGKKAEAVPITPMRSGEVSDSGSPPKAARLEPGREQVIARNGKLVVIRR